MQDDDKKDFALGHWKETDMAVVTNGLTFREEATLAAIRGLTSSPELINRWGIGALPEDVGRFAVRVADGAYKKLRALQS